MSGRTGAAGRDAHVLAVDVGGTKLAAARVSAAGDILRRVSAPTPRSSDAEDVHAALSALVDEVLAGGPVVACGVGCGGPMTPRGELVSPLNIPAWRDFPLRERLEARTGVPVFVDNDAKALALGEGWRGGARGRSDFLAMVVSTGVGGGLVVDGRLLDGQAGNAGHVGHMVAEPGGALCGCGARGCLEAEISGTAIERATGRPAAEAPLEVRRRSGRLLGRVVGSVVNLLDIGLVLVAGSVALGFGRPFFEAAQEELDRTCRISFARGARVQPAALGADGPLVGAAAVALRGLGHDVGVR